MDDLYGTDPVADNAQTRTAATMTAAHRPCYVCGTQVDTWGEHIVTHPWGRSKPERVMCSDRCLADYSLTQERERARVAS